MTNTKKFPFKSKVQIVISTNFQSLSFKISVFGFLCISKGLKMKSPNSLPDNGMLSVTNNNYSIQLQ